MVSAIFLLVVACTFAVSQQNEAVIRQNRPLSSTSFDEIMIDGSFQVYLNQTSGQPVPSVDIETTSDAQGKLVVEIRENHILSISVNGVITVNSPINVYIKFPTPLRRYTVKGIGKTVTDDAGISNTGNDKLYITKAGTADIDVKLNVPELELQCDGTGDVRLTGEVREFISINAEGVVHVEVADLKTKKAKVVTKGATEVRVSATEDIEMDAAGSSVINYRLPAGKKPSKSTTTGASRILPLP